MEPAGTRSQEDRVRELSEFTTRRKHFNTPFKPPSSESRPRYFAALQREDDLASLCGRPIAREHHVPATLYNEALCRLRNDLTAIEPTSKDRELYQDLRTTLNEFFPKETDRKAAVTSLIQEIVGWEKPLTSLIMPSESKDIKYYTDGDMREEIRITGSGDFKLIIYLQEIRNETTGNTSDPYFEAICSYRGQIRSFFMRDKSLRLNYPAVFILQFGT